MCVFYSEYELMALFPLRIDESIDTTKQPWTGCVWLLTDNTDDVKSQFEFVSVERLATHFPNRCDYKRPLSQPLKIAGFRNLALTTEQGGIALC